MAGQNCLIMSSKNKLTLFIFSAALWVTISAANVREYVDCVSRCDANVTLCMDVHNFVTLVTNGVSMEQDSNSSVSECLWSCSEEFGVEYNLLISEFDSDEDCSVAKLTDVSDAGGNVKRDDELGVFELARKAVKTSLNEGSISNVTNRVEARVLKTGDKQRLNKRYWDYTLLGSGNTECHGGSYQDRFVDVCYDVNNVDQCTEYGSWKGVKIQNLTQKRQRFKLCPHHRCRPRSCGDNSKRDDCKYGYAYINDDNPGCVPRTTLSWKIWFK